MRRVHFRYVRVEGMETLKQSEVHSWWGMYSVGSITDLNLLCVGTWIGLWWLRNVSRTIWHGTGWLWLRVGTEGSLCVLYSQEDSNIAQWHLTAQSWSNSHTGNRFLQLVFVCLFINVKWIHNVEIVSVRLYVRILYLWIYWIVFKCLPAPIEFSRGIIVE